MSGRPVWIDLANSPHVLFFMPVIDELRGRGVETVITARDFAQTVSLCERFRIDAEVIGSHGGASVADKVRELGDRVRALRAFAGRTHPRVAVSHNAYAQVVAARSLGLPAVTAMDYEFQPANHLAFRCASLVAVPDVFPLDRLRAQGAPPRKTWRYRGLKEHIALAGFAPDPGYMAGAGIDDSRPVVVVRPPADMALYHRFENPLFAGLLRRLQREDVSVVLLARTPAQAADLERDGFGDLVWRGEVLDGRHLVAGADAVVSAGGSMNREAVVLGTPAYSVYAGKMGAVDRSLVAEGRMHLIESPADVDGLTFVKKEAAAVPGVDRVLLCQFVDVILEVATR
jgi:predicted glycosyltransferase